MTTHTDHLLPQVPTPFTDDEMDALKQVRVRFQQDHDVLSERERARLDFLRWLVRSGRLAL
jgi:hypothetical protein